MLGRDKHADAHGNAACRPTVAAPPANTSLSLILHPSASFARALSLPPYRALLCSPLAEMELPPAESPSSEAISMCMVDTASATLPDAGSIPISKLARRDDEPPASAALNSIVYVLKGTSGAVQPASPTTLFG